MAKDIQEVNLGTADIYFKGDLVGHTKGGVTVNLAKELAEAMVDDYGETVIFHVDNGTDLTVTVPLAQLSLDTLEIAYPYENKVGSDLHIGQVAGGRSDDIAGELIVLPKSSKFAGQALTLYLAAVSETADIRLATDEQTIMEVTFKAYVDETKTNGVLGKFGVADLES
jgi:hypothetical protein